jgi:hypothetical protein
MTNFWRTLVLIVVGLGAGWAATRIGGGPPTVRNALDDTAATGDAAVTPPPEAPADAPPGAANDGPTAADVEAQIRRAEAALGDRADPDQELPVDPLRADVAIALPSDI